MTAIIVDDEIYGVESLERLLSYCEGIELIGKSQIPEEAIDLISNKKPDIVFLDVEMPRLSGFDVLEIIRSKGIDPIFIFTTGFNHYAVQAIKAKAFDYLLKPIVIDELRETLIRVSKKSDKVTPENSRLRSLLSSRENEVLNLITKGKTSKQIANNLFISKATVDTHRRNILDKTGLNNTTELIIKIMERD